MGGTVRGEHGDVALFTGSVSKATSPRSPTEPRPERMNPAPRSRRFRTMFPTCPRNVALGGYTFRIVKTGMPPCGAVEKGIAMLVTTADIVPGVQVQLLGLVRGNIVTSKNVGRDLMAGFKAMAGGEIKTYTDMTNEAREIAEQRMIAEAQAIGADAVVAMRFSSEVVMDGCTEMLAYGTAVKFV